MGSILDMDFECPICGSDNWGTHKGVYTEISCMGRALPGLKCSYCGAFTSFWTLDSLYSIRERRQEPVEKIPIERFLYYPTKIANDGREYDYRSGEVFHGRKH